MNHLFGIFDSMILRTNQAAQDTICAPATAPGRAAIAVVRISGPASLEISASCFSGQTSPLDSPGGRILYGAVTAVDGSTIDDILLSVFRAPHSYTGEDSVEISCHGNPLIVQRIMERLVAAGARPAEAGEFTRRAFENGKMDLTQVEAVSDIIHASSRAALRGARNQLDGRLSAAVGTLRDAFIGIASLLELELDFSEEDVEFVSRETLDGKIAAASEELAALIDSYRYGKVVHDGVHVAIVGPPNAGKSSLLNYFLKEKRAIVSHIPGTTRDLIREEMQYEGFLFILSDTAGLRDTDDPVEQEGVRRSRDICREADVVVLLSQPGEDASALESEVHRLAGEVPVIRVRNKTDLEAAPEGRIGVSALTGEGMDTLLEKIRETALEGWQFTEEGALVTSVRHHDALVKARESLETARKAMKGGYSSEFVAQDIRGAVRQLGEILGEIKTDEVLESIFSGYCIGK